MTPGLACATKSQKNVQYRQYTMSSTLPFVELWVCGFLGFQENPSLIRSQRAAYTLHDSQSPVPRPYSHQSLGPPGRKRAEAENSAPTAQDSRERRRSQAQQEQHGISYHGNSDKFQLRRPDAKFHKVSGLSTSLWFCPMFFRAKAGLLGFGSERLGLGLLNGSSSGLKPPKAGSLNGTTFIFQPPACRELSERWGCRERGLRDVSVSAR